LDEGIGAEVPKSLLLARNSLFGEVIDALDAFDAKLVD
jgi:hypothetical protein